MQMKVKNLYVVERNFTKPLIVKKPNLLRRTLANLIKAEITTYQEITTKTNIQAFPYELSPLLFYLDDDCHQEDIPLYKLKQLKFLSNQKGKRKIGF